MVAAGAVVTRDVPDFALWSGAPRARSTGSVGPAPAWLRWVTTGTGAPRPLASTSSRTVT